MKRNSPFAMHRSPRRDRSSYDKIFDEDDLEQVPMSSKRCDFLERTVMPEDTLQSIALEFNVTIADLKRVNNIHKDNEIFARRVVKIPHKPYSLLLESKFYRDKSDIRDDSAEPSCATPEDDAKVLVDIVNNSKSTPLSSDTSLSPDPEEQGEEETDVLLGVRPTSPDLTTLKCKCADSEMSPRFLLFVVVLIGLGGPAAYVWFFWAHVEKAS